MQTTLGERFARTVGDQDAEALRALLAPRVRFHALTPGGCWESDQAAEVVDEVILGTWFPPARSRLRILDLDWARVGPVEHVGYRLEAALPDGGFIVEQQAYLGAEDDRIAWLRILCSGFHRDR